jgi:hypothetical protein
MKVRLNGKVFTGITYNQGAFSGDRGHVFIGGVQQCSHALSLQTKTRVWLRKTMGELEKTITYQNTCQACAKNVTQLMEANKTN